MATTITETNWYPKKRLIITHLSGDLVHNDIERWEQSLKANLGLIEDNSSFKIFVNLFGFKAVNIDAHKRFRDVVPVTLAGYGWKVGYLGLFEEEAKAISFTNTRGIRCLGAAHAHQDETKINLYDSKFSSERERFFTDPVRALQWIEALKLND